MKKSVAILGVVMLAAVLAIRFYGRPAYRHYKENRAVERARAFLAQGDFRNASLSARQAFQLNQKNVEACRILAELAEKSRSPSALDYRRRVADLAPTVENKLSLASAALRAQGAPYPLASQTLEELADSAKDVPAYHVTAAELALKLNHVSDAAAHFAEASRLEPSNELHQVNLAALRLQSTNDSLVSEARATLERVSASTQFGAAALRWLVADSLRRSDAPAALRYSAQLTADSHALLEDRLQHLTLLQQTRNPEFDAALAVLQKNAVTNATEIYGVTSWMIAHGKVDDAMQWLGQCPPKVRAEPPAPMALVDCYMAKKDWSGLEGYLSDKKWGDLDFLRYAFLSRAAGELKQDLAADTRWRTAVREAGERWGPLTSLLGLARSWGRNKAREDLLWQIVQRFPRERWALEELGRFYQATGNTRGLNRVSAAMASYDAKNFVAQNNLAATSLLLKLNLSKAHEIAKEVYQQHPEEAIVTATYAYSLHLQGRTREGLAAMEKLKPEALESPSVALYYAVLLSALGDTNKSGKYFDLAQQANLLPEEKALIAAVKGM